MAFIPSIGATHLLPLPPTAPGPVNTSTIYGEVGSWTLAAGEYLYGVELTSLFQSRPERL